MVLLLLPSESYANSNCEYAIEQEKRGIWILLEGNSLPCDCEKLSQNDIEESEARPNNQGPYDSRTNHITMAGIQMNANFAVTNLDRTFAEYYKCPTNH